MEISIMLLKIKRTLLNLIYLNLVILNLSFGSALYSLETGAKSTAATHTPTASLYSSHSLFPFGHTAGHTIKTVPAKHVTTTADTTATSSPHYRCFDIGMGASVGLGAGYFMSKSNPRTALLLTATSLATATCAGIFFDNYHTEVTHLKAGFREIAAIKAAQATQHDLLATARKDICASKELIETTFGVTAATNQRLQALAAQQELNKLTVSKLDSSVKTTQAQVSQVLAQTQTHLVSKITTQAQITDSWFERVFGKDKAATTDSATPERRIFDNYSERWN